MLCTSGFLLISDPQACRSSAVNSFEEGVVFWRFDLSSQLLLWNVFKMVRWKQWWKQWRLFGENLVKCMWNKCGKKKIMPARKCAIFLRVFFVHLNFTKCSPKFHIILTSVFTTVFTTSFFPKFTKAVGTACKKLECHETSNFHPYFHSAERPVWEVGKGETEREREKQRKKERTNSLGDWWFGPMYVKL